MFCLIFQLNVDGFSLDFYIREILLMSGQNEGQKPYANFKTACFVKYLGSMLTDFHKTSKTGIFSWDRQNEV